jgi:hypothetical protein
MRTLTALLNKEILNGNGKITQVAKRLLTIQIAVQVFTTKIVTLVQTPNQFI